MRRFLTLVCTALLLACFTEAAGASVTARLALPAARAPHPLALDPMLADPAWKAGLLPHQRHWMNITTRKPAKQATQVYVLYDDRNLYVGFLAHQPSAPITASQQTDNVGFGNDDFVAIGVDTSGTGSRVYFFEVTPRGIRYQQSIENTRYRPTWHAAAKIVGTTWHAVMIIPLAVLRLSAGTSTTWRIDGLRSVAATNDKYSWAYDGLMDDGGDGDGIWPDFTDARFWPSWRGLHLADARANQRPKPRLELYGLGSFGSDRTQFQQANGAFATQSVRSTGLDLSYPITSTINLVGTLAPDFSNVEVDQQTIAPQEFRRNLAEYRPFFAQGAAYVNNDGAGFGPNRTFYSPGIGPFDRGAKVEGTFGEQQFGVLNFRGFDQTSGNTFDDVAYGYKHALPNRTFLYWSNGVFAHHSLAGTDTTMQFGAGGRNLRSGFVWGLDHAFERGSWLVNGIAHASNGFIDLHKPDYEINLGYVDLSPTYNPLDGFTQTSDLHGLNGFAFRRLAIHGVKKASIFVNADRYFDGSGAVHQADFALGLVAQFKNNFSINGLGPAIGELRQYDIPANPDCSGASLGSTTFGGFPCYRNGTNLAYNVMTVPIGYKDGSPTPIDAAASWGTFGTAYLHQYTIVTARPLGRFSLGLEYDGSYERDLVASTLTSQWLRRVSLGYAVGRHSNVSLSLRSINGLGGFATQEGSNLAFGFHARMHSGDLYLDYGTPAAGVTLHRLILKYVFRVGADAGT